MEKKRDRQPLFCVKQRLPDILNTAYTTKPPKHLPSCPLSRLDSGFIARIRPFLLQGRGIGVPQQLHAKGCGYNDSTAQQLQRCQILLEQQEPDNGADHDLQR